MLGILGDFAFTHKHFNACYVPSTRDTVIKKMDIVPVFLEFIVVRKDRY